MQAADPFQFVCDRLGERVQLDRLALRGAVRLALEAAGFEPRGVQPSQMAVVVTRMLPKELTACGVPDPEPLCASLAADVSGLAATAAAESPDAVFRRLGG
jgi:hypothetical protein